VLEAPRQERSSAAGSGAGEGGPSPDPRSYDAPVHTVFAAGRALVLDRGWRIAHEVPPAPIPEPPTAAPPPPANVPPPPAPDATIEAVAPTLIFAFPDRIVLRFRPDGGGTRVDMRSASAVGAHDLGQNARRIRAFFADLDAAVTPVAAAGAPAPPPDAPGQTDAPAGQ
jgi:hypothetical protein